MTERIRERAFALFRSGTIKRRGPIFTVPYESKSGYNYFVNLANPKRPRCGCGYWIKTSRVCKHIAAALMIIDRDDPHAGTKPPEPPRRYPRDWELYNLAEVSTPWLALRVLRFLALQLPEVLDAA